MELAQVRQDAETEIARVRHQASMENYHLRNLICRLIPSMALNIVPLS
jgi:hypothetical protein